MLDADDALTADCDVGDGSAWEERWSAGDDMEAKRMDGVMKLVCPATRLDSSWTGESRSPFRNVTLRNIFMRSFWLSSRACVSFSFPFFVLSVLLANSSTGGAGSFFDRVAVRKLCSRDERNLWKDLEGGSGVGGDPNTSATAAG